MKFCTGCKATKNESEFWKNKARPDGLQAWCKTCWKKVTDKRRNGDNRELELRQRQNRHLIRTFNITIDEYDKMSEQQNDVCAICHKPNPGRRLAVDHDHETGNIRGLLCENCNRGLGMFKDNILILESAIRYLS